MGIILSCLEQPKYKKLNTNFELISAQNKSDFAEYLSYKSNRIDLHRSVNHMNQNYLMYFMENNLDLLEVVCTSDKFAIDANDLLHVDSNGLSIIFYIAKNLYQALY